LLCPLVDTVCLSAASLARRVAADHGASGNAWPVRASEPRVQSSALAIEALRDGFRVVRRAAGGANRQPVLHAVAQRMGAVVPCSAEEEVCTATHGQRDPSSVRSLAGTDQ